MIVPVVLNYNFYRDDKTDGLWIFYKYLDFAYKNNSVVVGRDIYFNSPKKYKNKWDLDPNIMTMYNYSYPNEEFMKYNEQFSISDVIYEKNKLKYSWDIMLKNPHPILEKKINEVFDKIEKIKKEKIDMVISWYPFYSLKKVCDERKIKFIAQEFSAIREEFYSNTLGVCSPTIKYDFAKESSKFCKFDIDNNNLILSREELIILFSKSYDLENNLKILKSSPLYEVGYPSGTVNDPYEKAYCNISQGAIIDYLQKNYLATDVLYRPHPQSKIKFPSNCIVDNSRSSREFVAKCSNIIVNVSNIGYEGMLFGRKVTHLCATFLTSFGEKYNLDLLNDDVVNLKKLNFITFYLFTPYELMFDSNYLKEIFSDKSVNEIYMSKLKYILKKYNISYKKILKMNHIERKKYFLEKVHSFNEDEINYFINLSFNQDYKKKLEEFEFLKEQNSQLIIDSVNNKKKIEEFEFLKEQNSQLKIDFANQKKKITELTFENEALNIKLNSIFNSFSWKIISVLRNTKNKIFRRKNKNV